MQSLAVGCGLLSLPRPARQYACRSGTRRPRLNLVYARGKGSAPPPVEAPAEVDAPQDIPSYFQPAPPQQQMYQAVPQYQAAPPPKPGFWGNLPPIVLIGIGVVVGTLLNNVLGIFRGGPQKMQEMAMEQMMKQMMKQMGGAQGGANPFGAPGANPFGGASPFGGPNPFGMPPSGGAAGNPFGAGSGFPTMPPAFDTTATPAGQPSAATATPAGSTAAGNNTSSGSSTPAEKPAEAAANAAPSTEEQPKPKKRSAFQDVSSSSSDGAASSSNAASSSSSGGAPGVGGAAAGAMPPPPFGAMPGGMPPPPFQMPQMPQMPGAAGAGAAAGGTAGGAGGTGAGGVANTMLDMLKNPEMQKMLYPYLPEPMRNQETFEWMLSNPEYRQQLEQMLAQQAASTGSPAVAEMMQGMDMSPEKMNAQFAQLGMTPDQFLQKVMSDPDLASMMSNPKVMAAIAECTKNPMAIFQYQGDEQIMRVFEKMSQLFPQAAGGGMPQMPPGFGMPPGQQ